MSGMRNGLLAFLLVAGCEPSRQNRADDYARGLSDIHHWDPVHQAVGSYAYDGLLGMGEDAVPVLVERLTDLTKTRISELAHITTPVVGDVAFHMLLKLTNMRPEHFALDGVVVLEGVDNPIYAVRFNSGARERVQRKFRMVLRK